MNLTPEEIIDIKWLIKEEPPEGLIAKVLTTCIYRFKLCEVFELVYTGLMFDIKYFFGGVQLESVPVFGMVAPIYGVSGIPEEL
jgi:hypothetical protein